ncbi:hypothetical protein FRB97_002923 [Tulasnella sp. 331]|nr:hypothetical protein FRB97_002923 [Tulasnella sp. 331]
MQALKSHPVQSSMEADLVNPPPDEVMYTFDPIKLVVYREDDLEVTLEDFEGALDGIEKWVEEWKIERHTKLLHVMVSAGASPIEDPPTELDFNRLSLATTIFFCSAPYSYRSKTREALCLTNGGQHTASRQCRKKGPDWSTACLNYNTEAEEMVRQLVVAVGLDPETTTAAEMDAEDARFYCQGCPKWDKLARSWRNCVRLAFATPVQFISGNIRSQSFRVGSVSLQQTLSPSFVKNTLTKQTIVIELDVCATPRKVTGLPTPFSCIFDSIIKDRLIG